jgi:hypothetical protein
LQKALAHLGLAHLGLAHLGLAHLGLAHLGLRRCLLTGKKLGFCPLRGI